MPRGVYAHRPPPDLAGQHFGSWCVRDLSDKRGAKGQAYWVCVCSCGAVKPVLASNLRNGKSTSCGCAVGAKTRARQTTHGDSQSIEYRVWQAMWQRCNNPKNVRYMRYGGRGIKVCQRWEQSYEEFLEDMGRKPYEGYSIERRDNDDDYSPENCYWATPIQQNQNTSRNRVLEYEGQRMSMAAWAERVGLPYQVLNSRLNTYGWSVERALTTPHRTLAKRNPPA